MRASEVCSLCMQAALQHTPALLLIDLQGTIELANSPMGESSDEEASGEDALDDDTPHMTLDGYEVTKAAS